MSKIENSNEEKDLPSMTPFNEEKDQLHESGTLSKRFWKTSSYLQLIAIVTLVVTLSVTMTSSVSSKFRFIF